MGGSSRCGSVTYKHPIGYVIWVKVLRVSTDSGFRVKKVSDGPNKGYWIVDTTLYRMRRTVNAQATYRRDFASTHPVPPANVTPTCKKALGLKGKVAPSTIGA